MCPELQQENMQLHAESPLLWFFILRLSFKSRGCVSTQTEVFTGVTNSFMVAVMDMNTGLVPRSEAALRRFSRFLRGISNLGWSDNSGLESYFPTLLVFFRSVSQLQAAGAVDDTGVFRM